ncbi:MAG: SLC13 family permease [Armatimonadota bacterium]
MHRRLVYAITRRRWLIIAILMGTILLLLPSPAGLKLEGWRALVITIVAILLFVAEAVPLPAVAFIILVSQVLLGINSPSDAASSFMDDSVFFIMGSLMLAVAVVKQRLDRRTAYALVRISGPTTTHVAFGLLTVSALIASFVGGHSVAGLMLPVALVLVRASGEDRDRRRQLGRLLLLCVAYGCIIAGLGTPSGGVRNVVMIHFWAQLFDTQVTYADWIKFAYPAMLLLLPAAFTIIWFGARPPMRDLSPAVAALRKQVAGDGRMGVREWAAIGVFAGTLAGWITVSDRIGLGVVAMIGATCYLVFGLVEWSDYNQGVNWGVILVYGAAISLGQVLQDTGAADWVATSALVSLKAVGIGGAIPLLAVAALISAALANAMAAGAAVAVLAPILLQMAKQAHLDPVIAGFVVALAASFNYMTVFAHPASMIVYGSGLLQAGDFARLGWRLLIVSIAVVLLLALLYWPHLAIPRPASDAVRGLAHTATPLCICAAPTGATAAGLGVGIPGHR